MSNLFSGIKISITALLFSFAGSQAYAAETTALPDEPTPFLTEGDLPSRTAPLIELGGDFLGTGNISPGFQIPTGAVWQPRFWVYGNARTAIETNDVNRDNYRTEWTNSLNLFGNLQLTGTERILIGFQPLQKDNRFSGKVLSPSDEEMTINEINADVTTFFFEGDLAELFPRWDVNDSKANDFGFTIGRQNINFQSGMLINDTIDAIGFSKNSIRFPGVEWLVNMRTSFLYSWDEINRDDNQEDDQAELYGLFFQLDTFYRTMNLDFTYVDAEEDDVLVASIDAIQTIGKLSTTFRIAGSTAINEETRNAGDGVLLFGEIAWVPPYSHDNTYISGFAAIDNFVSAARGPTTGGALGQTGILFAGRAVGSFPAPLSNRTSDAYGAALGRQFFFSNNRRQVIVELGVREEDFTDGQDAVALGVRFQQALGKRTIVQLDGFVVDPDDSSTSSGFRVELQIKL